MGIKSKLDAQQLSRQLRLVFVHAINLTSTVLGDDLTSSSMRKALFRLLGARFGPGTKLKGGGYVHGGGLVTGARCYINRGCYFDFTGSVTLGNDVVVGHGATFITAGHTLGGRTRRAGPVVGRPIRVGDGSWIGANAVIMPGVSVGEGAVVAAGAVVSKDVPADVVVAGVPARVIRGLEGQGGGQPPNQGKDGDPGEEGAILQPEQLS